MACGLRLRFTKLLTFVLLTLAVSPATTTTVPPLQWIELTDLTSGSSPAGLSYASIGYDSDSHTLIIFGGESNGFPQQQTYLLNVSSLTWSSPNPAVQTNVKPPARSMAISGGDFAASNRHGHVVIGGKDLNGQALSDAWEYDYNNQFWTEINISPPLLARYSASGGIDSTSSPVSDPIVAGPNNTFYLAGGYDGDTLQSLSNVWKFEVAGVLSPNLPTNNTFGSWSQITFSDDLPSRVRQAGTVMPSARVVSTGGCDSSDFNDRSDSCAQQDSHVLNIDASTDISPDGCPAPRVGPVLAANRNAFSNSFASQVLMLLGTFNDTLWDDGGGLNQGEVDILDVETGVWTRVLPSGDPSSGSIKFPVPRQGAVAVSSSSALVGSNSSVGADIIVFGGQDADGNYLNDIWLLRTYAASIASTNATWAGFGSGSLGTGVDATGSGVTVQFLTSCAKALNSTSTTTTSQKPSSTSLSGSSPGSSPGSSGNSNSSANFIFDTHTGHKILSPVSVGVLLAALVFYRLSLPSTSSTTPAGHHIGLAWVAGLVGLTAYAVGIAGVVLAFTTISSSSSSVLERRLSSSSLNLKTNHGKVALAFFVALYGLLPLLFGLALFAQTRGTKKVMAKHSQPEDVARRNFNETGLTSLMTPGREKIVGGHRATSSSPDVITHSMSPDSPVSVPRSRARSLFGGHIWYGLRMKERTGRLSIDSGGHESTSSAGLSRSFEVLNRGNRARRLSANGLNEYSSEGGHAAQTSMPRSLGDLNWLDRRQNVAAFGELDYALTQLNHTHVSAPAGDARSTGPLFSIPDPQPRPILPSKPLSFLHVFLHAVIFGICVVALVALWQRAPKAAFIVFLIWTVAFYGILFLLAWQGMPRASILTVLLNSLRCHHEPARAPVPNSLASSRPLSAIGNDQYAFPSDYRSPYTFYQPPFRRALSAHEDEHLSSNGHGAHRPEEEVDEDEETQQRRIEQEMDRRDVSIITVPRRKLWIANPS